MAWFCLWSVNWSSHSATWVSWSPDQAYNLLPDDLTLSYICQLITWFCLWFANDHPIPCGWIWIRYCVLTDKTREMAIRDQSYMKGNMSSCLHLTRPDTSLTWENQAFWSSPFIFIFLFFFHLFFSLFPSSFLFLFYPFPSSFCLLPILFFPHFPSFNPPPPVFPFPLIINFIPFNFLPFLSRCFHQSIPLLFSVSSFTCFSLSPSSFSFSLTNF